MGELGTYENIGQVVADLAHGIAPDQQRITARYRTELVRRRIIREISKYFRRKNSVGLELLLAHQVFLAGFLEAFHLLMGYDQFVLAKSGC
jgi:hypothetical protein